MITGTGIDIIELDRIEKAIKRWGNHFLDHVFNKEEIAYASKHKFSTQHYAARFAAKEAVLKAFGDNAHIDWKDMTITHDKHGRPVCKFNKENFKDTIHISISHTHKYAVASAIIEKKSARAQK